MRFRIAPDVAIGHARDAIRTLLSIARELDRRGVETVARGRRGAGTYMNGFM